MALVGICTPMADRVPPAYYRSVMEMQAAHQQHQFMYIEVDTVIVGKARVMIAETALAQNPDVLFWVDDDTLIPQSAGVLIDQALEMGIVSGVYYNRRLPYTPQVYIKAKEDHLEGMYWPDVDVPDSGLIRRDAIGAGCVAIRADVYQKLTEAWAPRVKAAAEALAEIDPAISDIVLNLSPWYEFLDRKGEDLYFSERVREAGLEIWVNCDIQCLHLSSLPIGREHFRYLVDNGLLQKVEDMEALNEMAISPTPSG